MRFGDLPTDQAWQVPTMMNNLLIQVTTDGEEGRATFIAERPSELTCGRRWRAEAWPELWNEAEESREKATGRATF